MRARYTIAHAGRKASTAPPFDGARPLAADDPDHWPTVGPSAIPTADNFPVPHELTVDEIAALVSTFATAARRALNAGFKVLEIHGAHGYLLHSFLSPISNQRTDQYGNNLEGRMRFPLEVCSCLLYTSPSPRDS